MRIIIILMPFLYGSVAFSQTNQGVKFNNFESWSSVLQKAQIEKKNIIVDLFATWCWPCKRMDTEVYSDPKLGKLINNNLIAIKVQMDSTLQDDPQVKSWYDDASYFKKFVSAYPTILFFSPGGQLIETRTGYLTVDSLLVTTINVLDPLNNYLVKIQEYNSGKLKKSELLELSYAAKKNLDTSLAESVAKTYKEKFITYKQPKNVLDSMFPEFITSFSALFNLGDPIIKFIIENPEISNKYVYDNGFSDRVATYYIRMYIRQLLSNDEIRPGAQPNWKTIERSVISKIRVNKMKITDNLLLEKISYYTKKKEWNLQASAVLERIKNKGINAKDEKSLSTVNDLIYNQISLHPVNQKILKQAIEYMEVVVTARPANYHYIDTYAGILYKAGYIEKAISEQKKASQLAKSDKAGDLDYYETVLRKMQTRQL